MTVNYIYNENGKPEYAVIPFLLWKEVQNEIAKKSQSELSLDNKEFNPSEYKGLLSNLELDIDKEIETLRSGWQRDLS